MDLIKNQQFFDVAQNTGELINYPGNNTEYSGIIAAKNTKNANYSGESTEYPGEINNKNNYSGVSNNNSIEPRKNNYFYSDRANPRAFNKAPKIIIFSGELTTTEKTFYLILQDYQWRKINPSQAELAQTLNCTERNIRKLVSKLKEAGLIKIIRTGRANSYLLVDLETTEGQVSNRPAAAADGKPAPRLSRNRNRSRWRTSTQVEPQPMESQSEQSSSNEPEIFLPEITEAEFQSERNCNSPFELNPINKNNKNHVCNISGDIPQRDMTEVEQTIKPKMGSRGQPLVVGGGETPLVVQGAKSPASFSKATKAKLETELELDEKHRDFVKVFENLREFGFSEKSSHLILGIAYKRHGDQAEHYLQSWAERINNYSWVENPCGYMRRAVAENWNLPKRRQRRSNQAVPEQPGSAGATSPAPAARPRSRPRIERAKNFQQYIERNSADYPQPPPPPQPNNFATESATTTALDFAANWALTAVLKQLDPTAAQRFKCFALDADGQSLVMRFYGIIPELNLELMLATVKVYYPQIERVLVQN